MRLHTRKHLVGLSLLGGALLALAGCDSESNGKSNTTPTTIAPTTIAPTTSQPLKSGDPVPVPDIGPPAIAYKLDPLPPPGPIPRVLLSSGHAKTCLVKAGDVMPAMSLVDLDGSTTTLADYYGQRVTIVIFWTTDHAYAQQEFREVQRDYVDAYKNRGVNVIGVNVGQSANAIRKEVEAAKATFPQLIDVDGKNLEKIASERLPRTYVLDAKGRILWLDIEYSLATRRLLRETMAAIFHESPAGP